MREIRGVEEAEKAVLKWIKTTKGIIFYDRDWDELYILSFLWYHIDKETRKNLFCAYRQFKGGVKGHVSHCREKVTQSKRDKHEDQRA